MNNHFEDEIIHVKTGNVIYTVLYHGYITFPYISRRSINQRT